MVQLLVGNAPDLEAQQRYSSYRAILVAMVSQNSFVLVFVGGGGGGVAESSRKMLQKWSLAALAQMCLCETN